MSFVVSSFMASLYKITYQFHDLFKAHSLKMQVNKHYDLEIRAADWLHLPFSASGGVLKSS